MPPPSLPPFYASLASAITVWAQERPDVHVVLLVGSYARADGTADDWSDLDLVLFVTDPTVLTTESSWLNHFGPVLASRLIHGNSDTPEWLVLFADGTKVDLMFVVATGDLRQMLALFPYQKVLRRGMVVLLDKTATAGMLQPLVAWSVCEQEAPPPALEFTQAIDATLVIADKAVRLLQRGELWRAKMLADGDLKLQLLEMLAWHAQAHTDRDTWYEGRNLDTWADPAALLDLPSTFAIYDLADVRRALAATLALYRRLAEVTAAKWGYAFPSASFSFVASRITGKWPATNSSQPPS